MTGPPRRRPMRRVGDVLPGMAAALGLEDQLRLARAMAAWTRLVEELAPAASGASHLLAIEPPALVIAADSPIVGQELRLRASELLGAFAGAPGGQRLLELRVIVRSSGSSGGQRRGRPG